MLLPGKEQLLLLELRLCCCAPARASLHGSHISDFSPHNGMGDGEASTADEAENAELHQFDRPILGTPNVCLWALKKKYLHAFHKKSKTGQGIFIVREHLIQVLFACGAHSKRNIALRFQDRAQGFLDFANSAGSLGEAHPSLTGALVWSLKRLQRVCSALSCISVCALSARVLRSARIAL